MDSIKEWLLALLNTARSEEQIAKAFKVQRHRQLPIFTVKVSLDWGIMALIRYQDYSTADMESDSSFQMYSPIKRRSRPVSANNLMRGGSHGRQPHQ